MNIIVEEDSSEGPDDSVKYYLEYESKSDRGGDILLTLEEPSCSISTRAQRGAKVDLQYKSTVIPTQAKDFKAKVEGRNKTLQDQSSPTQILKRFDLDSLFDIVEFCKTSRIQISPTEYLRMNPNELNKLIHYIHKPSSDVSTKQVNRVSSSEETKTKKPDPHKELIQPEKVSPKVSYREKPDPFYVSLFLHGFKLRNCIIDSGASNNIMPTTVAKFLDLPLIKTFGKCYSMDSKQVPLVGQIKDAQVSLAAFLHKRVKLTILVEYIPTSYGMLLSRTFCWDLGGEVKMDWSQEVIPIGKEKVTLLPEAKSKYIVFPFDDFKSQILYQETDFSNYLIMPKIEETGIMPEDANTPWVLKFDGSFYSSGLGIGIVLISPLGNIFPSSFKLTFENTNNTVEYEALLLGKKKPRGGI